MTAARTRIGPAARRDLAEHVRWLRDEADSPTAERFALAVAATFDRLAATPMIGALTDTKAPDIAGTRKWRVDGFNNLLVFYIPESDGIRILRVLHASRGWRT